MYVCSVHKNQLRLRYDTYMYVIYSRYVECIFNAMFLLICAVMYVSDT